MKKLLCIILTIFITLSMILLGLSINIKITIIDSLTTFMKSELTNELITYLSDNTGIEKTKINEGINKAVGESELIKNTITIYYDKITNMMNTDEPININLVNEVEYIIDASNPLLKDYGINITKKDKEQILATISKQDVNKDLNDMLNELKTSTPSEIKTAFNVFNFFRSVTFQIVLLAIILLSLLLIALLKKSPYKWLTSLSVASIITSVTIGFALPTFTDLITKSLTNSSTVFLSTTGFKNYVYLTLTIGIISLAINFFISKVLTKKDLKRMEE